MKIVSNEKLIKRNGRLGQIATFAGMAVLIGGLVISFSNPDYAGISWIGLLVGFALTQIGIYFSNRWGRRPRPDELLDKALKGLTNQYTLYHYQTPAAHLLVGPSGMWVIMPYYQVGNIVYEKGRWKQKGGGFMQRYLRLFAQEGLGRPDIEGPAEVEGVARFLKKRLPQLDFPEPRPVLVFLSDKAVLDVEDAPILTIPLKELKETIRKNARDNILSPMLIDEINQEFA